MRERVNGVRNVAMRRRITVKQIADKAGLSVATVDRVLNGRRNVSRATALRVQSATEALGYQPAAPLAPAPHPELERLHDAIAQLQEMRNQCSFGEPARFAFGFTHWVVLRCLQNVVWAQDALRPLRTVPLASPR